MITPTIKARAAIACDEIRREDNGKLIVIGVYSGTLIAASLPSVQALTWLIVAEPKGVGDADIFLRILLNGDQLLQAELKMEIAELGETMIPLPRVPITLKEEGALELQLSHKQKDGKPGKWQTVGMLHIKSAVALAPTS